MENLTDRGHLVTEQTNPASEKIDTLSSLELVDLFNQEDVKTIEAIKQARESLAKAMDLTTSKLRQGGRLFYVGAGTSGRLGVLDAAECPPTFCTPPEMVQGIIAGGAPALLRSSEALEDKMEDGASAMAYKQIHELDVVVGITAGGTTPFVHGAMNAAKQRGAATIFMSCVPMTQVSSNADVDIRLITGPEIVAGSTRLKAGTVTKMALNIISTGVMVKLGKVYGNRMVDVAITNQKLLDRSLRIIQDLTDLNRTEAKALLEQSGKQVKLALLMHWSGLELSAATLILNNNQGILRDALRETNIIN